MNGRCVGDLAAAFWPSAISKLASLLDAAALLSKGSLKETPLRKLIRHYSMAQPSFRAAIIIRVKGGSEKGTAQVAQRFSIACRLPVVGVALGSNQSGAD